MDQTKQASRRDMLRQSTAMLGSIVFIPLAVTSPSADAGSMSREMLHYQDSPKDGKMCADCAAYTASSTFFHPDAPTGICKILKGPVNPQGWCISFSRR